MRRFEKGSTSIAERCQQIWIILISHVMLKPNGKNSEGECWNRRGQGLITYADLAEQMGIGRGAALSPSIPLKVIGLLCKDSGLPPLNVVVVSNTSGSPSKGVVENEGYIIDQRLVMELDWFGLQLPSIAEFDSVYSEHFRAKTAII